MLCRNLVGLGRTVPIQGLLPPWMNTREDIRRSFVLSMWKHGLRTHRQNKKYLSIIAHQDYNQINPPGYPYSREVLSASSPPRWPSWPSLSGSAQSLGPRPWTWETPPHPWPRRTQTSCGWPGYGRYVLDIRRFRQRGLSCQEAVEIMEIYKYLANSLTDRDWRWYIINSRWTLCVSHQKWPDSWIGAFYTFF